MPSIESDPQLNPKWESIVKPVSSLATFRLALDASPVAAVYGRRLAVRHLMTAAVYDRRESVDFDAHKAPLQKISSKHKTPLVFQD
jgi:hypothetical protein